MEVFYAVGHENKVAFWLNKRLTDYNIYTFK